MSESAISRRTDLHPVFRGVYAVGHTALSREGRWLAGVLAAGEGAVLRGESLAALYGLQKWAPSEPEVLVPRRHRPISGITLRTTRTLDPRDVTVHKGVPCLTVPRLLIDLSDSLIAEELTALIHEAAYLHLLDLPALQQAIRRANGHHNLAVLMQAIADWLDGPNHKRPPTRITDRTRDDELVASGWTVLRARTYELAIEQLRGYAVQMPAGGPDWARAGSSLATRATDGPPYSAA